MRAAVEHHFNGLTGSLASYDSTKTLLPSLLRQASGSNVEDNFISTKPAAILTYGEGTVAAASSQQFPHIYKWSNDVYWIFTCQQGTVATRNISLTEFNSTTSTISFKGFITLSGTTIPSTKGLRSLRAFVYDHTTGTVSTSGASTTITGNSTQFTTERIAVGARIGFGTTDPTQVLTWYEITAITNDTTLTINSPVTLSGGTSYVIEEIRIATAASAGSIVLNNGIFLIKGLNYGTFTVAGTIIPEATTVDNIRASYLLKDAAIAGAASASVTLTQANPGVFTCNNHTLQNGDAVAFTTAGALPTNIVASATTTLTPYYVISSSTNTFQLATTLNGTGISTIAGSNTGVHTLHYAPTNLIGGLAADDFVSFTQHDLYAVTALSSLNTAILKFNMRAQLSMGPYLAITTGVSTSSFSLKTSTQAVGNVPLTNCARVFTVAHGPASGSKSVYYATTAKIYRAPLSTLTSNSTNYVVDAGCAEIPPGGLTAAVGNTYVLTNALAQVDYSSTIDRMIMPTSANRLGMYIGQYTVNNTEFDKLVGSNLNRVKFAGTPGGASDGVFPQGTLSVWTEDGWMFIVPTTVTTGMNWLYVFPFGADAYYANTSNQYIITPKLATPNASKLYHVYVDHQEYAGTYGLGFPVETYKLWYRTSGIDDNSGAWNEVPVGADLTAAAPGDYIQFKVAFDIMGEICVPTRIYSICCTYEDKSQDSHYEPSLTKSSAQNRQFAWRQISSWGGTIPNLRIRLFNVANNATVLDDDVTSNTYGTWQYSTDGTNWLSWSSSADTIGNYIRYTADDGIIGNLITVRALLTQA